MRREYHKWFSPQLGREMELLVFGHAGERVIVFPSRMARFYEYEDKGMVDAIRPDLINGRLQLFCIDSVDAESLYCYEKEPSLRIARHLQFESYVLDEVIPFSASQNLDLCAPLAVHGCSLGAYHAVAIAFRHPCRFQRVVAFSGRYDLTESFPDYHNLFYGFYDLALYYILPSHFLPLMEDPHLLCPLRRMAILLVCGVEDQFFENNAHLSRTLHAKGVPHQFIHWHGRAHRFRYWRQMVRALI